MLTHPSSNPPLRHGLRDDRISPRSALFLNAGLSLVLWAMIWIAFRHLL
jgi:hypothetical protein